MWLWVLGWVWVPSGWAEPHPGRCNRDGWLVCGAEGMWWQGVAWHVVPGQPELGC